MSTLLFSGYVPYTLIIWHNDVITSIIVLSKVLLLLVKQNCASIPKVFVGLMGQRLSTNIEVVYTYLMTKPCKTYVHICIERD